MMFSLTWLKDHLNTEASVKEIVDTLNAIGLEVEGVEDPAVRLAGFTVAKVLTAEKHPDADKLQVLTVDTGSGDPLQVVCGAPNARAGMKGVLGQPGAIVPSNGMELRKSAIRGVESNGMMCSVRELELGDEHDGIIELPENAPVGQSFADYHGTSPIIDVAITPNRPDCMGVYGIARDLAAAGLGTLKPIAMPEFETSGACPVEIRTDDTEGCPAFYGRVITGVKNGPSPDWLQQRLTSAGQRPISLLVDLTNYLMLAYGRPAHAYDLAKLTGAVVARRAKNGEQVLALNEKTYTLDDSMTVIADDAGVHDVAGIMGGEDSGCSDHTTDVLLEIAYFDPARIGVTGRKLGLASDARTRFERGVDPTFLDYGLDLLTGLIVELAGGTASEKVHAGVPPSEPKVIAFDTGLTARLGGINVPVEEQKRILESLDFAIDGDWNVTCPLRRHDIEGPADLVEEVVRIHGLDKVESVALPRADGVAKPTATAVQLTERRLRRAAAASGLNEAITWSFISEDQAESVGGGKWVLDNPISEDMKVMRPSLLPGLLSAVQRNLDRGASSIRLFEIGRRYLEDGEHPTLVCVLAGDKERRGWASGKATTFDAYDAKAICLELLEAAGAPVSNLMVMGEAGDAYHPGQSATLRLGPKNVIAGFGMIHPSMLKAYDIDVPVAAMGIHLDAIPAKKNASFARSSFAPPALQAVTRDFAFLVPTELAASDLVRAVKGADKINIVDARVFDVFAGQGVPEGKKSVAVEVTLQPTEKSYKDADLKAISDAVVASAAKQGAELRG
ncbi:MAG: phenylalanine--tRNA ligase subunit beta [Altererythrobacter sp. XM-24bin4]|jgi:phenylalanyl-tRNA synthetase beta chain|uniref:phenylalanine--tRNA ligase subunit beta n=1 Tax=uncultured Altererythrobacter sp. TaxID=500840 RepID=UPI000D7A0E2A|nr:phenylalanine--tRNA ligase subunit beta [uncultured Altererythrobacter sp.]PWL25394.1 MAG: phenylalanine--tRNA ligase subunit beta [Altererythrobacter sp. XM-24bin4]